MKRVVFVVLFIVLIIPSSVVARRGCCSHHGGVVGCSPSGRQVCADGSLSPTCTCSSTYQAPAPTYVYGCTNANAFNYNPNATKDDGSCIAKKFGCMDTNAINYDSSANVENDSCQYQKETVRTELVKYGKRYQENENLLKGHTNVAVKGENGEKEVVYQIIVDRHGNVISENKISERVVKKPVDEVIEKGIMEEPFPILGFLLWIISVIFSFSYFHKHRDKNLLLTEISKKGDLKKLLLYFAYIICILPPMIDMVIIVFNIISKRLFH